MILLYGMIGAGITGAPLTGALIRQHNSSEHLKQQVSYYQKQEEESRYLTVWTLKQDIAAGEKLTEGHFEQQQVRVQASDQIGSISDIGRVVGKNAKTALAEGTIVQEAFFYEGEVCTDDVRIKEVTSLRLPEQIKENEYVDVRISFPNGEDYIVVRHKKIQGILQDAETSQVTGIRIELTEEEILRLSAAEFDVNSYRDTALYAIQYREDFQKAAVQNYPVNEKVFDLLQWDPNVAQELSFEDEQEKRALLEEHLEKYKQEQERSASEETLQYDTAIQPSDMTGQKNDSELEIFE